MADDGRPVVAVTGAGGFVGTTLVPLLRENGFAVRALSRSLHASDGSPLLLPHFDAPDAAFDAALAGAAHVVHAGGLTNVDPKASETDLLNANARLTGKLAEAAGRTVPGRFVFVSSIRAVAGQDFGGTIDASTTPAPSCAYGRSKREGELAAAQAFRDRPETLTILRPAPIYGRGMKGNLRTLLKIAETPYPLPLAGLRNRRSLLDVEALASAVVHALAAPSPIGGAYIVSDAKPLSIADIITAFRAGMGRRPRLFALPPSLLTGIASLLGRGQTARAVFTDEICDPSALEATGWIATRSSVGGLMALARPMQDGAHP